MRPGKKIPYRKNQVRLIAKRTLEIFEGEEYFGKFNQFIETTVEIIKQGWGFTSISFLSELYYLTFRFSHLPILTNNSSLAETERFSRRMIFCLVGQGSSTNEEMLKWLNEMKKNFGHLGFEFETRINLNPEILVERLSKFFNRPPPKL